MEPEGRGLIRVGDRIRRKIKVYDGVTKSFEDQEMDTTVVWIHPERRFYVVRCDMPGGRFFHEALYFYPRCGSM